jgi:type IV pilus assembly protein PilP
MGIWALWVALFGLVGCQSGPQDDLQVWMNEQSAQLKPNLKPLPEIKPFPMVSYETVDILDPFQPAKIVPDKRVGGGSGLAPDFERPKEELEKYPLDALRFVGLLRRGSVVEAIVIVDKKVYRVRIGQHMGQDFGKIVRIETSAALDEGKIVLEEIVQDSNGDWQKREKEIELMQQEAQR